MLKEENRAIQNTRKIGENVRNGMEEIAGNFISEAERFSRESFSCFSRLSIS
jgi:hypothetical protein